ncbi:outer membrane protein assembly factor BamB family protein [Streptomyces sp. NPDC002643]
MLIAEDGPRVIDFGISRAADNQQLTRTGRVVGTPPFMSPEQLRSPRDVTGASDVFSLGSLLVFAVSGNSPFEAESPYMAGYQVMYEAPELDAVPQPLRAVAERCLQKDPAARPDLTELHHLLWELPDSYDNASLRAPAPTPIPAGAASNRTAKRRRTKRQLVLIGLGAALTVTALTGALLFASAEPESTASRDLDRGTPGLSLPTGWLPWRTALRHDLDTPLDSTSSGYMEPGCVADGTDLYCGGTGFVVAKVDAATGTVRWWHGTQPQTSRPVGARDGLVYAFEEPDDLASSRLLTALDSATGKRSWARSVSATRSAHLFDGGVLAVGPGNTRFVAYSASGERLWRTPMPDGKDCTPLVLDGVPYGLCYQGDELTSLAPVTLVRLDPADGTAREVATLPSKSLSLGILDDHPLFLGAAITENVFEGGYERPYDALLRVDPDSGKITRIPLERELRGSISLVGDVVYFVRADGSVTAVSATDGEERWETSSDIESLSVPAVSTEHDRVYFANRFGRLLALDSATGDELWRTESVGDPGSLATQVPPSVLLVEDAIVAMAGDTVFSVSPDEPSATPRP